MNRTKSRELAFKLIYEKEIQKEIGDEELKVFFESIFYIKINNYLFYFNIFLFNKRLIFICLHHLI